MKNTVKVKDLKQFMVTVTDKTGAVVTKRSEFSKYAAKQRAELLASKFPESEGFKVEKKAA